MEQLKSSKVWKTQNDSDRMARDLVRNAQKNPYKITAKELQKRIANTGLAVHRTTLQCTSNNYMELPERTTSTQNEASDVCKRKH